MKVTAFIRKTSAKNNVTDLARVYFRVRDIGGVDIKAASEPVHQPEPLESGETRLQTTCGSCFGREEERFRQGYPANYPPDHQGIQPWS